ncbi:MAG: hypothetical protein SH868_12810 [Bythopirellula sp.]|nr:hypothetical protein [Bythopirellula sp.]
MPANSLRRFLFFLRWHLLAIRAQGFGHAGDAVRTHGDVPGVDKALSADRKQMPVKEAAAEKVAE